MTEKLKVLDLFSGIGGFALGFDRAGMETIAFCEVDEFCRKVLKKHWPLVPAAQDVKKLSYNYLTKELSYDGDIIYTGPIDVVSAGYPCQGESIAGKRLGQQDDRWLWKEVDRIIKECRADWFIGENVSHHANMGLDIVLSDLEAAAYTVRTFDIASDAAGLPTMERHLWIIAAANSLGCKGREFKALQGFVAMQGEFSGSHQREQDRWSVPSSRVCGVAQGISNRTHRLRTLGNAVPPRLPEMIGNAISEIRSSHI